MLWLFLYYINIIVWFPQEWRICEIGIINFFLFLKKERKRCIDQPQVTPLHTTKTLCKGWVGMQLTCLHHFSNLDSNRGSPPQTHTLLIQSKQNILLWPILIFFPQLKFNYDCVFFPIHLTIVARYFILNHSKSFQVSCFHMYLFFFSIISLFCHPLWSFSIRRIIFCNCTLRIFNFININWFAKALWIIHIFL